MSTRDGNQHGHVPQSGSGGSTPPRPSATFLGASAAPAEGRGDVSPPRPPPASYESSKVLDQIPARGCATKEGTSTPANSDRKWSILAGSVPRPVPILSRFAEIVPSADSKPKGGASSSAAGRYRCPRPRPPSGDLQESFLGVEIHDTKSVWKRKVAKAELPSPSSARSSWGTFFFSPAGAAAAEERGDLSPRSAPASSRDKFLMQRQEGSGASQEPSSYGAEADRKYKIGPAGVPPTSLRVEQSLLSADSAAPHPGTSSCTESKSSRSAGPGSSLAKLVAGLSSRPPPEPLSPEPEALCTCKCETCNANPLPNPRPPGLVAAEAGAASACNSQEVTSSSSGPGSSLTSGVAGLSSLQSSSVQRSPGHMAAEVGVASATNSHEVASSSREPQFRLGSNYWAHLPASDDLNPAGFYSPHPLWEGFAIPAKESGKRAFRCAYCRKTLLGTADKGVKHLLSNRQCSIPDGHKELLKNMMGAYHIRKQEILKRKRA